MDTKQIDDLLHALQNYEMSIAELYDVFSDIFPTAGDLWKTLAKEERLHAKWIMSLNRHLKNEKLSFHKTKLTVQSTETAVSYILQQIDRAKREPMPLKQAVIMARDIERALLESSFLTVFNFDSPEAQKILNRLKQATQIHKKRVDEWVEKTRNA